MVQENLELHNLMHYDHYGLILPNHKFRLKWQPTISVSKFIQSFEPKASFNSNGSVAGRHKCKQLLKWRAE